MKIVQIDPSLFTWPYDIALAQGLMAQGHEVLIYARAPFTPLPASETQYLRADFYHGLDRPWTKKMPSKLFLALKGFSHITSMLGLWRTLRRQRPDVIHFQWAPLAVVDRPMIGLLRRIAPVVLTVHDSEPFNDNPKSIVQRVGAIDIMRRVDHVIVHTAKARDRVISYGVAPTNVSRIAHGVLDRLPEGGKPWATPAPADGALVILLFGQLKPYKGIETLLRAYAAMPAEARARSIVRIVGRPQMPMEPIFALAEELGIADRVDFELRFIDDDEVAGLLQASDILAFPYLEIDASGVLMLALAAAKAMVASNIGLFRELMEDGVHGALVPPGDAAALSRALTALLTDDEARTRAGTQVAALGASIPTWSEIGAQTADVYDRLIDARRDA